jgi:hypothetical protein
MTVYSHALAASALHTPLDCHPTLNPVSLSRDFSSIALALVKRVAGLKLVDFYGSLRLELGMGLPILETRNAESIGQTLRYAQAVGDNAVRE